MALLLGSWRCRPVPAADRPCGRTAAQHLCQPPPPASSAVAAHLQRQTACECTTSWRAVTCGAHASDSSMAGQGATRSPHLRRCAAAASSGAGAGTDGEASPSGKAPDDDGSSSSSSNAQPPASGTTAPAGEEASTSGAAAAGGADAEGEAAAGPWSPDDIMAMVDEQDGEDERDLLQEWSALMAEDPLGLSDYVERAYAAGPQPFRTATTVLSEEVTGKTLITWHPAVANDIVGMGTWRLREHVDPAIELLVARIEGSWRELLDDDLTLYPKDKWKAQGWDLADSEDPERELKGFSIVDVPDPEEGAEGYPRLMIENRIYCSRVFRKLHIEVAVRQDGLQVLHVVLYPRYNYDLPILAMDFVLVDGRCTLAVVDACPLSPNLQLPHHYMEAMVTLQQAYLPDAPKARRIPDWGSKIFSPLAICTTPQDPDELAAIVRYTVALHRAHLGLCSSVQPVLPVSARASARLQQLLEGHKRFVDNQLVNGKTRRVLDKAFSPEWSEQYMTQVMFDFDPTFDPPFYDSSIGKLYDYFAQNPNFGPLNDEAVAMEQAQQFERASQTVMAAAEADGDVVSEEKLEMAMELMYQSDPRFQAAVDAIMPELLERQEQGLLGKALSRELLNMLMGAEIELQPSSSPAADGGVQGAAPAAGGGDAKEQPAAASAGQ